MLPDVEINPDVQELRQSILAYFEYLESPERHEDIDSDYENDIFEAVIDAFSGEKAWDWINSKKI